VRNGGWRLSSRPTWRVTAIRVASDLVRDLYRLEETQVAQSEAVRVALDASCAAMDAAVGQGAGYILDRVTVSPGVIQGGLKINMLPGSLPAEGGHSPARGDDACAGDAGDRCDLAPPL
jgi:hypothetical protein